MSDNITELMEICMAIERKTAELYDFFSDLYREMPELSRLWHKTALEEENHMLQFELAIKLRNTCSSSTVVSLTQAQQALAMIAGLCEKVREQPPTWQNALKSAIELENNMSQFHTNTALVFRDDNCNDLFQAMMKNDHDHVQALSQYLMKLTEPRV